MRILHVIRGLANSSGTTHIVGPLAEAQARLGHDVTVRFVDKPPFPAITPDPALVRTESFAVTVLRNHPGVSIPFARAIDRDIGDFDVLHVHAVWNFPSFYAMRAAAHAGTPFMVAPQGSLESWALNAGSLVRRAYAARIEGPLIRRANRMQALTTAEAVQFNDFGYSGPISIIPNGISTDWLQNQRAEQVRDLGIPPGARTLLFLSRIHPKKGLDLLLHGFACAQDRLPNVFLVIAGDDAGSGYLAQMKQLSISLKLENKCRFVGEVSGDRKRRIVASADAFALTSHSEGLPVAVLEAMASGVPVLITPGCNLPEVTAADAGLIVTLAPEAIAAGLSGLFADLDGLPRRGANGRALVAERFTWPIIARECISAYALMAQRRAECAT